MLQTYYPEPSRKLFLPFTYPIVLDGFVRVDMCNNLLDCYSTGKMIIDGVIGGVSGKMGGAGVGNITLDRAAKLMNQNAIRALKNGTKNGVRGAIKFYASSRPVKRYYTALWDNSTKQLKEEFEQNLITGTLERLFPG